MTENQKLDLKFQILKSKVFDLAIIPAVMIIGMAIITALILSMNYFEQQMMQGLDQSVKPFYMDSKLIWFALYFLILGSLLMYYFHRKAEKKFALLEKMDEKTDYDEARKEFGFTEADPEDGSLSYKEIS